MWGSTIGAVSWDEQRGYGAFEYTPKFQQSGIQLAPIKMPLGPDIYSFPELSRESFYGLPGLLADALPDKFGNLLIDEWLVRSGRDRASFTPVERLCYVGIRAMGSLEFQPALRRTEESATVEVDELVKLAADALAQKKGLETRFSGKDEDGLKAMRDILRVGTSAGGARAKAIIAWNETTGEVRSGQVKAPPGFGYWIMKFDGVSGNRDNEIEDPEGYGLIEYAYYRMAAAAGVQMSECRLFRKHGRNHFMTKRFDRTDAGEKVFMQSLCALGHYDFNQAGAYSYEQAIRLAQDIGLDREEQEQLFRRAVFNIMARNQDDHTKNIAFLMDKSGTWHLAPAFDVAYSYNPGGVWTSQHQMTLNGKRTDFTVADFRAAAKLLGLFRGRQLHKMLEETDAAIAQWTRFAEEAGVIPSRIEEIARNQRRLDRIPAN